MSNVKTRVQHKQNHSFNEAPLFQSCMNLLKDIKPMIVNMQADFRNTFGHNVLNDFYIIIGDLQNCYRVAQPNRKLTYARRVKEIFNRVEISVKMMGELRLLTVAQMANLSLKLGDIYKQINGWYNKIEGQANKANSNTKSQLAVDGSMA